MFELDSALGELFVTALLCYLRIKVVESFLFFKSWSKVMLELDLLNMTFGLVHSSVKRLTSRHGHLQVSVRLLYMLALVLVLCLIVWKWVNLERSMDSNQKCGIGFGNSPGSLSRFLAYSRKLGNCRSSEGLRSLKPSRGTNLLVLIILAGDIEMNLGPRSQCRQCKTYFKATDKVVKCQECSKCFHVSCANLSEKELGSEKESWYCKDCKAECGLCGGDVLNNHKAVQCDKCEMRVHNDSFVTDFQNVTMQNASCTCICPNCEFFNFSDSFFSEQFNLEDQNRFISLAKDNETRTTSTGTKITSLSVD